MGSNFCGFLPLIVLIERPDFDHLIRGARRESVPVPVEGDIVNDLLVERVNLLHVLLVKQVRMRFEILKILDSALH